MKKILSTLLLTLLLALLITTPSYAKGTVCKIGSKGYSSLQAAVDAVKDGQTITVTKAIKATERVQCKVSSKTFTIDFRKKKYTYNGDDCAIGFDLGNSVVVKNMNMTGTNMFQVGGGSLTISSGKATCKHLADLTQHPAAISKLTIKGGTLECAGWDGPGPFIMNHGGNIVISKGTFKNADIGNNQGTLSIKGGNFKFNRTSLTCLIENGENCTAKISGGQFESQGSGSMIWNKGKITISGGTYLSTGSNSNCLGSSDEVKDAKMVVTGGTFETRGQFAVYAPNGLTIKGGTFTGDINGGGTISGGTFKGEVGSFGNAKLILKGGTTTIGVGAHHESSLIIENFTVKQGNNPKGSCLSTFNNGKITVKGGKFTSKNGMGYSGNITFTMKNYKKLFNVKMLTTNK